MCLACFLFFVCFFILQLCQSGLWLGALHGAETTKQSDFSFKLFSHFIHMFFSAWKFPAVSLTFLLQMIQFTVWDLCYFLAHWLPWICSSGRKTLFTLTFVFIYGLSFLDLWFVFIFLAVLLVFLSILCF